jgi:small-conductance mechanosensitive channel
MLEETNIDELSARAVDWIRQSLLSADVLGQLALIVVALLAAWLLQRALGPRLGSRIDGFDIPTRAARILKSIVKLILPLAALVIVYTGSVLYAGLGDGRAPDLLVVATKLLVAWIVISSVLQFVENAFARNLFTLAIWAVAALSIFGVLDQTAEALDSLAIGFGDFRVSVLAVLKGLFAVFILLYLALFASSFAERRVFRMSSVSRSTQVLLAKIVRVTLIVIALLIAVTSAGIDLSLFAVFGGALGLGIGFGLQKGVSNLFSGMLLLMDRSIKPGDVIELPEIGAFGWVNNMAARYTEIVTRDNKSVLIPNEDFITQRVINWSHGNRQVRIHVPFGVHYDSDPHRVTEIAIEAARSVDRVVSDPAPVCWITEFGDSAINFDLRFWIQDAERGVGNMRGKVFLALWDAFQENGIRIPYPHREVFLHRE